LAGVRLHLTRGIHLVVPHARLPVRHIVVMQARDRRSAFAVPRGEVTYLGTTDTDHGPPTDHPAVPGEDADSLLAAANRTFGGLAAEELPRLVERVRARLPQLAAGGAERLVALHGAGAERLLARACASPAAGELLPGGILRAEIAHALDEEMALTLEDLLERR